MHSSWKSEMFSHTLRMRSIYVDADFSSHPLNLKKQRLSPHKNSLSNQPGDHSSSLAGVHPELNICSVHELVHSHELALL